MQFLKDYIYIANFAMIFIVIPFYRLVSGLYKLIESQQEQITTQADQIDELKKIVKHQREELAFLRSVIFETTDAELLKNLLTARAKRTT